MKLEGFTHPAVRNQERVMNDPIRDCQHGHKLGKCDTCDLMEAHNRIAELEKENDLIANAFQEANNKFAIRVSEMQAEKAALEAENERLRAELIVIAEKMRIVIGVAARR